MMTGTNPQIFGKELSGNLSGAALQKDIFKTFTES